MRLPLRTWLAAIAWMGAIFVVSAQPSVPSVAGAWDVVLKKLMHVVAYGVLTWLYLRALREGSTHGGVARVMAAVMAVLYALSDEYHQTFVPGRNGSLADVAVDALGILGVTLVDWRLRGRSSRQQRVSE